MNTLEPLMRLLTRQAGAAPARLAEILGIDAAEILAFRLGARCHYRPMSVAKKDGRPRHVLAPSPPLKRLQRRLLDGYLATLPVHPCATAFHRSASIVHNARCHALQTLVATVDLRDFFACTRAGRVHAFFHKHGWRGYELHALMLLCVFDGGLPQGAPTSPCLSNLVNFGLDERLNRLAQRARAVYTRYCDDLTFSWNAARLPDGFERAVEDCLHAAGYEVQPCKGWCVRRIHERPRVTGIVLRGGGRIAIPWEWRWRLWQLRWRSLWSRDPHLLARLAGYEGLIAGVNLQ